VSARLVVPSALRASAGGAKEVAVEGATLRAVLDDLSARMPVLERRIRDEQGRLRPHVLVFVDGLMVRAESDMETPVPEGCEVLVAPAVSGGAPAQSSPPTTTVQGRTRQRVTRPLRT